MTVAIIIVVVVMIVDDGGGNDGGRIGFGRFGGGRNDEMGQSPILRVEEFGAVELGLIDLDRGARCGCYC